MSDPTKAVAESCNLVALKRTLGEERVVEAGERYAPIWAIRSGRWTPVGTPVLTSWFNRRVGGVLVYFGIRLTLDNEG